ncbi:hypothetical protein ACFVMC_22535 [Nocardia sp. NPDC127579]|uniref:hypothetical protein n=1 Tax=Nocardia sp. NPDC127579 TaxID=3345402 RepID=UPI00363E420C
MESLPYPQRMGALARHARAHAAHPGFPAFLTDLAADGAYGRRTALHLAMAARDLDYVARVLAGPEPALRRAALRAVRTLPVPDEAIPPVLSEASTELRIAVYRTIVHARRAELADGLLARVHANWGAGEAARLLAACSPVVVAQWLPVLMHAVTAWKPLARRHPQAVLRCLDSELASGRRWAVWRRHIAAVCVIAEFEPGPVLDLLERHDLGNWAARLPDVVLGRLFRADPRRAAPLLLRGVSRRVMRRMRRSGNPFPVPLSNWYAALPDDELVRHGTRFGAANLLSALPIQRRREIYPRLVIGEHEALRLLHLLPDDLAEQLARRLRDWLAAGWHSARAHLDDPKLTLRITSFLPFPEAEPALRTAAFAGDPRHREVARTLLLSAAHRTGDRAATTTLLGELVTRLRNDRDPARAAFLEGLVDLRLDPHWTPHLTELTDTVLRSRDTSERTRDALRTLADRALNASPAHPSRSPGRDAASADRAQRTEPARSAGAPHGPAASSDRGPSAAPAHPESDTGVALGDWALRTYGRLIDRYGGDALAHPADAGRVPLLERVLRRGQERELFDLLERARDHRTTVILARALGARVRLLPELLAELRQTVLAGSGEWAGSAASILLRHSADRETEVAALVGEMPAALRLAAVWRLVATRRTELLTADPDLLAAREVEPGMPGRWTDAQRESVGRVLRAIAADRAAASEERLRALRGLSRIPFHNADLVAHALGGEPVLADAALEALSRYPRVLPRLLLRVPGPVALATAAQLCRISRPTPLREHLERALFEGRVGARKLAARQLVSQRVPEAADLLLRAWADPDLHPDARVAVAVALSRLPEHPGARAVLAEIPGRYPTEVMIRTLLQVTPEMYPPEHRSVFADLAYELLAATDLPGVRFRAAKAFAAWAPWFQRGTGVIVEGAVTGGDAEMTVFRAVVHNGVIRDEALTVLRRLLAAGNHARAREVAEILDAGGGIQTWRRGVARAAAELLLDHPTHLIQGVRMLTSLLPMGESDSDTLAFELNLLADRLTPVAATRIVDSAHALFRWSNDGVSVLPAIRTLIARDDLTGGILALGLVEKRTLTTEQRTALLEQLRSSRLPELRQLAWDVR